MKNKVIKALILAGGYSKRINLKTPKQLVKIDNKPLLAYTLGVFERCKSIDSIILVVHKRYILPCRNLVKKYRYKKVEQLCLGGKTRQQSVFNALKKVSDCDYVVIHDGVRPFVTQRIISRVINAAKLFGAATCAVQATDTTVEAKKGSITSVFCRNKLWRIQTPQAFKFELIFKAHQKAKAKKIFDASDDTQLLLGLKKKVKLVGGSYRNIKVTTMADLLLIKKMKTIIG